MKFSEFVKSGGEYFKYHYTYLGRTVYYVLLDYQKFDRNTYWEAISSRGIRGWFNEDHEVIPISEKEFIEIEFIEIERER